MKEVVTWLCDENLTPNSPRSQEKSRYFALTFGQGLEALRHLVSSHSLLAGHTAQ